MSWGQNITGRGRKALLGDYARLWNVPIDRCRDLDPESRSAVIARLCLDKPTRKGVNFDCVVNPYHIYVHNRHSAAGELTGEAHARIDKTLFVMLELTILLRERTYASDWEL